MITATTAAPSGEPLTVRSRLLGDLIVPCDHVLEFAGGLFGFPDCKRFALLSAGRDGMFWLQSMEHGALAFLLVDPFTYFDGYTVDLSSGDLAQLGTADPAELHVLAIATLPARRSEAATVNLQGPIIVNTKEKRGHQAVIAESSWGTREPLPFEKIQAA